MAETKKGSRKAPRTSRKGVKIASHKGGRTERFECRLTPAEKQIVMERVKSSGLSAADWLMAQAQPTPLAPDGGYAPAKSH
jgi:hypothetical protein